MNYTVCGISIKVDWCATGDKNHGDDDIAIPIAVAIWDDDSNCFDIVAHKKSGTR